VKRALLVGGSGLVGRALVERLLAEPGYDEVHALLRRPIAGWPQHAKLRTQQVDFVALPKLPPLDEVFIALGTTIKQAGSQEAFRAVDYELVLAFAERAKALGVRHFLVISALGANARSLVFYNRVKGEMEAALQAMDWPQLTIVRPSLLLGPRREFRLGERLAAPLLRWIPGKYRGIEAAVLARALWRLALEEGDGVRVVESDELRRLGR